MDQYQIVHMADCEAAGHKMLSWTSRIVCRTVQAVWHHRPTMVQLARI